MQDFDKWLFLQKGADNKFWWFKEKLPIFKQLLDKYDAQKCQAQANQADWMLEVIGAAAGNHTSSRLSWSMKKFGWLYRNQ